MPNIPLGSQVFDLAFHPTEPLVFAGLLNGQVKGVKYDEQGNHTTSLSLRPSKRSCRGLALNAAGEQLWAVGKNKSIHIIDTVSANLVDTRTEAHKSPINRVKYVTPWLFATGDDDGVIKLWDPRQPDATRSYAHHFDFITDFAWLEDKKHLVATSGDGTLSVLDVRSKTAKPFAQSEDQEDELLSILPIKGGTKLVVGTQIGILSIFNRKSGWGDCVDRIPGHPSSVDALCGIPTRYPSADSTILTGSSDGIIRAVEILPTKFVGIVADHEEFPVERIAVDRGGEGDWIGSVGHEDSLKLTNLREIFEDGEDSGEGDGSSDESDGSGSEIGETVEPGPEPESDDDDKQGQKRRKRKQPQDFSGAQEKKKAKNEMLGEEGFFSEL